MFHVKQLRGFDVQLFVGLSIGTGDELLRTQGLGTPHHLFEMSTIEFRGQVIEKHEGHMACAREQGPLRKQTGGREDFLFPS